MIRGIRERTDARGDQVIPLDRKSTRAAIGELIDAGAESLAVCLLWAFRNPEHEQQVATLIRDISPDIPVSLSHEIAPRMGEFERAVTTVINAYVGPAAEAYIHDLDAGLSSDGLAHPVQVVTSTGGAARATDMDRQAVSVVNSGPVAGRAIAFGVSAARNRNIKRTKYRLLPSSPIIRDISNPIAVSRAQKRLPWVAGLVAARFLGDQLGHPKIITADMGGTSFDVGLIDGDTLEENPQPFLDQGLPVSLPAVKLVTIGAGGGSIAWTDGYRLQVGPQSAGADPGPAAYDRGGTEPTVTDALIVCGIIDPDNFFGGDYRLNAELLARAVNDLIAQPLNMTLYEAASGILDIVNARMANLTRKVSIESGHDPADFALYAYGGATGAHCAEFARQLGIGQLILPYAGPVFSALGVAIADISYSHSRSEPVLLGPDAIPVINRNFTQLRERARSDMTDAGFDAADCQYRHRIELRYQGQMNEVTIDWPRGNVEPEQIPMLQREFEAHYEWRFGSGTTRADSPMELISFRVDATRPTARPALADIEPGYTASDGPKTRQIYLREHGSTDAHIVDFRTLTPGTALPRPAVVERDTTTI